MRAAQHELPLVQACAELVLDHDSLLIRFESLKLIQRAFRPQVRDNVQLPHLAVLLQFAHKQPKVLHLVIRIQIRLAPQYCIKTFLWSGWKRVHPEILLPGQTCLQRRHSATFFQSSAAPPASAGVSRSVLIFVVGSLRTLHFNSFRDVLQSSDLVCCRLAQPASTPAPSSLHIILFAAITSSPAATSTCHA